MATCSQPKCPVATTGVCLEGHKQGCPHRLPDADNPTTTVAETTPTAPTPSMEPEPFRFHSGEKLTSLEASRMISAIPVKVVLCSGAQWAGKTTFLARIGEMFRNGSFQDFRFAGSKTLCAFERMSWLATISSGAGRPDTPRSYGAEKDTFFHLRVQPVAKPDHRADILISDLPGEAFPSVLASREFCSEQRALARADHLVLFVDCCCLVDNAKRHSERDNASLFLSQVEKCRHDPKDLQVHIVFSRWDYVSRHGERQKHEEFCNIIEAELSKRFGNTFGGLRFARIAARPDGMPPTTAEIQKLFGHWLEESRSAAVTAMLRNPKPARDFCAFGLT